MQKMEVRGGLENGLTNNVIGWFEGPGITHGVHVVRCKGATVVMFVSFQVKMMDAYLHINGIRLNEQPALDHGMFCYLVISKQKMGKIKV